MKYFFIVFSSTGHYKYRKNVKLLWRHVSAVKFLHLFAEKLKEKLLFLAVWERKGTEGTVRIILHAAVPYTSYL